MRKKLFLAVALIFFFAFGVYSPREASAVPAFARQTGMACNSCHFQHFPTLNAFGRAFKTGGYTQVGGQSMIEGDFLSIPATLNATVITKIRYQKRNGDAQTGDAGALNKGQIQFPDEAAIILGGRAGEHIGFLLESSLRDGDSRFTSFKLPLTFNVSNVNLAAIPFTTDSLGPAYGFELLNTGAQRNIRPLEHRTQTSAQQFIGTDTAATGIALVAAHPMGFFNYSPWANVHGNNATGPYLNYFRAAVTPNVGGWDLGGGLQFWNGTEKIMDSSNVLTRQKADAWAADLQAQGTLWGEHLLGVYLTYANAKKSKTGDISNIYNTSTNKDKSAWSVMAELGVVPHRVTAALAYRAGKNGDPSNNGRDSDNATTVAISYEAAQNLEFQLNHSWLSGDAQTASDGKMLTTLMLFAAF